MSSDIGEAGGPTDHQGDAAWAARGSALSPDRTSAEQDAVVGAASGSNASSTESARRTEQDPGTSGAPTARVDQAGSEDSESAASEPSGLQPLAGDPGTSYDRGDLAVHDAFVGDGRYSEGDAAGAGLSDAPVNVPHEAT